MHASVGVALFIVSMTLMSCQTNLADVRATAPLQAGEFAQPAAPFAKCVREQIELASWSFGQPIVQLQQSPSEIRVNTTAQNSLLFELTFLPHTASTTRVEYRRGYAGHGTQDQAWTTVEYCAKSSKSS